MARTVEEIKKELVDNYLKHEIVRSKYGFTDGETLNKVSIENVLFYVVAFSIWVMEKFIEKEKAEIEHIVNTKMYGTLGWWREKVLAWQHGDATTVINGTVSYKVIDESKRLVKHVAVQAKERQISIKVASKTKDGELKPLAHDELINIKKYIQEIKPAGLVAQIASSNADMITMAVNVYFNGELISDTVKYNVRKVITDYFRTIEFDGSIYRNKIIDVVQTVEGVRDCVIDVLKVRPFGGQEKDITRVDTPSSGYYEVGNLDIIMTAE